MLKKSAQCFEVKALSEQVLSKTKFERRQKSRGKITLTEERKRTLEYPISYFFVSYMGTIRSFQREKGVKHWSMSTTGSNL
jgi:hypothetical protein